MNLAIAAQYLYVWITCLSITVKHRRFKFARGLSVFLGGLQLLFRGSQNALIQSLADISWQATTVSKHYASPVRL